MIVNKIDNFKKDLREALVALEKKYGVKADLGRASYDSDQFSMTLKVTNAVKIVCKEKIERDRSRGIMNRPIKAMVAGIPNVGKSTFINSYVGKTTAKTGNKPGVTRGNQWIRISKDVNLLDTPGILWPKLGSEEIGLRLALIGSINDNILELNREALLEEITLYKKCIKKGGELDVDKACKLILDDFRSGKLGRISLEKPEDTDINHEEKD